MKELFFSPPGLYYLTGIILIISMIIYWKRNLIKKELHRWQRKELQVGPLTLEWKNNRKHKTNEGVTFGKINDFTGAKIKRIAGRDNRLNNSDMTIDKTTASVDFGEKNKFADSEIEDIAGKDFIAKE